MLPGSFHQFALRFGTGIANGGDGGISRTWLTFGAPDTISLSFKGAYSLAWVNHVVFNLDPQNTLNAYIIMSNSKGAADTDHRSKTYFGREVYNRKLDFTIGARHEHYFNDYFHFLTEFHYSQRKDETDPLASMIKFSIAPILFPRISEIPGRGLTSGLSLQWQGIMTMPWKVSILPTFNSLEKKDGDIILV